MRRIPVDVPALGDVRFVQAETRTDEDGKPLLRGNVHVQRASVLVKPRNDKPEVIEVNVVQDDPIRLGDNEKIRVENLTVMLWQNEGRAGLSYNADAITSLNAPAGMPKP